jgi:hypothetical protein
VTNFFLKLPIFRPIEIQFVNGIHNNAEIEEKLSENEVLNVLLETVKLDLNSTHAFSTSPPKNLSEETQQNSKP